MKNVILLVSALFFLVPFSEAQRGKKSDPERKPISGGFSYERQWNKEYPYTIYFRDKHFADAKEYGVVAASGIWLRQGDFWVFADSLRQIQISSDRMISKYYPLSNSRAWVYSKKAWTLIDTKGQQYGQSYLTIEKNANANDVVIGSNKEGSVFVFPDGRVSSVQFLTQKVLKTKSHYVLKDGYGYYFIYDLINDQKGKFEYDSVFVSDHGLFVKRSSKWNILRYESLLGSDLPLAEGTFLFCGSGSNFFFIGKEGKWTKYFLDNLNQPSEEQYDRVLYNNYNEDIYGVKNGKLFYCRESIPVELPYPEKDWSILAGIIISLPEQKGYDREFLMDQINSGYNTGKVSELPDNLSVNTRDLNPLARYVVLVSIDKKGTNKSGIVDLLTNEIKVFPNYQSIDEWGGESFLVQQNEDVFLELESRKGVIDTIGNVLIPMSYRNIEMVWTNSGFGNVYLCQIFPGMYDVYDFNYTKLNTAPLQFMVDPLYNGYTVFKFKDRLVIFSEVGRKDKKQIDYEGYVISLLNHSSGPVIKRLYGRDEFTKYENEFYQIDENEE